MVGRAVATMVWSSAPSSIAIISANTTRRISVRDIGGAAPGASTAAVPSDGTGAARVTGS